MLYMFVTFNQVEISISFSSKELGVRIKSGWSEHVRVAPHWGTNCNLWPLEVHEWIKELQWKRMNKKCYVKMIYLYILYRYISTVQSKHIFCRIDVWGSHDQITSCNYAALCLFLRRTQSHNGKFSQGEILRESQRSFTQAPAIQQFSNRQCSLSRFYFELLLFLSCNR